MIRLSDVNECLTVQPCANGATCVNTIGGYQCQCSSGFEGQDCDQGKRKFESIGVFWMHPYVI